MMMVSSVKELILTFGKVAKMLTAETTPEKYRVFKLRDPLPSVKKGKTRNNATIKDLMDAIGLQYGKTINNLTKLHYRKVIILTDQCEVGFDVKGSIINFFHTNWPELLRFPLLEEFIMPIAKIQEKKRRAFHFTHQLSLMNGNESHQLLNVVMILT